MPWTTTGEAAALTWAGGGGGGGGIEAGAPEEAMGTTIVEEAAIILEVTKIAVVSEILLPSLAASAVPFCCMAYLCMRVASYRPLN